MSVWKNNFIQLLCLEVFNKCWERDFFAVIRSNALTLKKGDKLREHLVRMINESSIPQMSTVNYILLYIFIYNIEYNKDDEVLTLNNKMLRNIYFEELYSRHQPNLIIK